MAPAFRSARPGDDKSYAGIVNALSSADSANMAYGDASAVLAKWIEAAFGHADRLV
jgi:NAD/NADP transhydrogenase beta subunit